LIAYSPRSFTAQSSKCLKTLDSQCSRIVPADSFFKLEALFSLSSRARLDARLHSRSHGRGFLAGSVKLAEECTAKDHRQLDPRFQGENFAANMNAVEIVRTIGAKPSQVALAWLLGKCDFIVPIPGTKRRVYLEENAGAVDIKHSDDNVARLEAALRPEAVSGPRYNEKVMAWVDR
jgi:hypothetical protein